MEEKELKKWYDTNHQLYNDFCQRLKGLIEEILEEKGIPYQSITCRTKSWKSFQNKCNSKYANYQDPIDHVMDMAGIRIIAYINSDVDKISDAIKQEFEIDAQNSINKADQMEENQVGYLSVHYIAKLNGSRRKLLEYEKFKNLCCEIQIRTLLQHAWAEIEHDRNYKFGGVLPRPIRRKFYLLAGTLEIIDNEFQAISDEIDKYGEEVKDETEKGNLDILIDSTSLLEYMKNHFSDDWIEPTFNKGDKEIIDELHDFGINSLTQLDGIIPNDYLNVCKKLKLSYTNYIGMLRDFMIIKDYNKYFSKCIKGHWGGLHIQEINIFKHYNVPVDKMISKYELLVDED